LREREITCIINKEVYILNRPVQFYLKDQFNT
jgi:hypothetical protein